MKILVLALWYKVFGQWVVYLEGNADITFYSVFREDWVERQWVCIMRNSKTCALKAWRVDFEGERHKIAPWVAQAFINQGNKKV